MASVESMKLAEKQFNRFALPVLTPYGEWIVVDDRLPEFEDARYKNGKTGECLKRSPRLLVTLRDGKLAEAYVVRMGAGELRWVEQLPVACEDGESLDVVRWLEPNDSRNRWIDSGQQLPKPGEMVLVLYEDYLYSALLNQDSDDDSYYWWSPLHSEMDGVRYWRPIVATDWPLLEEQKTKEVSAVALEAPAVAIPPANETKEDVPTKSLDKEWEYKDPRADWVSTADMLPSPQLEVLVIADGVLTTGQLCNEDAEGYIWFSRAKENFLHTVTHWQFHPTLPPQFEIGQREMHAQGLTEIAGYSLGDAEAELEKAKSLKKSLKLPFEEEDDDKKRTDLVSQFADLCVVAVNDDTESDDTRVIIDVYDKARVVCAELLRNAGVTQKTICLITEIGVRSALAGMIHGMNEQEEGCLEELEPDESTVLRSA